MTKRIALAAMALVLVTLAGAGLAQDQFLFLQDLQPGMEGVGKTVLRGNEIRTFQVRIVGLIDGPGELNDFIEVRVSGDVIRESGGVAAGMSGSPIYVDGKLIGALSRAIAFDSDPSPFALITPIGPMLKLLDPTRKLAAQRAEQVGQLLPLDPTSTLDPELAAYTELEFVDRLPGEAVRQLYPQRLYARRLTTPVLVSGLEGRAFEWLRSGVPPALRSAFSRWLDASFGTSFLAELGTGLEERYDVKVVNTALPAGRQADSAPGRIVDDLVPGGAVGVTLADGDVTVGALGTVTYREGNIVLAYGHPFLFAGEVEYFLTRAYIYDTVASLQVPFKLGTTTDRMGTLLQDRFQGVAGAVGLEPQAVRLNVRLTDKDNDEVTHYTVDLVRDRNLLPSLVFSAGLSLLDRTLNRVGKGTLSVDYTIRGRGLPDRLERQDIFTSGSDIAVPGPLQVAQVVYLLAQNEFQDPQLDTIDVDMSYNSRVRALRIKSIEADQEVYHPGETVHYTVTFQPFRGEPFSVEGQIRIPEKTQARRLTLHAFGGPRPSSNNDNNAQPEYEGLDQIINLVENLNRNDQLTVELLGLSSRDLQEGEEATDSQLLKQWVVSGEKRATLTVEPLPPPEPSQPEQPGGQEPPDQGDGAPGEGQPDSSSQGCDQLFFC